MDSLMRDISVFDWDYEGDPVILDKDILKEVLLKFINGNLSLNDLYKWADFLELREDVDYPEGETDIVSETMNDLANPSLQGEITKARAQAILSKL